MRLFLLSAILAVTSSGAFADNWSKQWTVSGSPEMHVETGDGSVHVSPGDGSRIEANITTRGWKIAPGEVTIIEHQTGNRVELEVRVPKLHFSFNNMNREIRVELRVPRDTQNFIHTGDGAIDLKGLHGKIQARTGDGSIEATDIDGTLEAHTGDGHIKVRGRMDLLDLETGDGSIEAELVGGSNMNSDWRMKSGDGHVTVRLPQDIHLNLDAHSGDGSVTADLPITVEGMSTKEHNSLRGKINGGGQTLTIRTGDGSIHLEHS